MAEFTNRMLGLAEEILVEFIRESGGDVQPADMDKLIGAGAEWLVTMRFSLNHSIFGKALTRAVNEGRIVATELENGWHYTLGGGEAMNSLLYKISCMQVAEINRQLAAPPKPSTLDAGDFEIDLDPATAELDEKLRREELIQKKLRLQAEQEALHTRMTVRDTELPTLRLFGSTRDIRLPKGKR